MVKRAISRWLLLGALGVAAWTAPVQANVIEQSCCDPWCWEDCADWAAECEDMGCQVTTLCSCEYQICWCQYPNCWCPE
jgi:hypothetical protein